jgi:hypothetical protein
VTKKNGAPFEAYLEQCVRNAPYVLGGDHAVATRGCASGVIFYLLRLPAGNGRPGTLADYVGAFDFDVRFSDGDDGRFAIAVDVVTYGPAGAA